MSSVPPDMTTWRPSPNMRSLEELDEPGQHLWVMVGALAMPDPERPFADPIGGDLAGPGCFKCEREYSRKLARRPCTGTVSA